VIAGWYNWIRANLAARLFTRPITAHLAHAVIAKQVPEELR